jgi:hypothetical protein
MSAGIRVKANGMTGVIFLCESCGHEVVCEKTTVHSVVDAEKSVTTFTSYLPTSIDWGDLRNEVEAIRAAVNRGPVEALRTDRWAAVNETRARVGLPPIGSHGEMLPPLPDNAYPADAVPLAPVEMTEADRLTTLSKIEDRVTKVLEDEGELFGLIVYRVQFARGVRIATIEQDILRLLG